MVTAEKTYQPATIRQQNTGQTFFRKAEEPAFFGPQQEASSFFSGGFIQPKLSVSHPDDPEEKEADAMADQVMRMAEPAAENISTGGPDEATLQRLPNAAETPILSPEEAQDNLQRKEEESQEADTAVQPKLMRLCAGCPQEEQAQAKLMRQAEENQEEKQETGSPIQAKSISGLIQPKANSPPSRMLLQRSSRAPPAGTSSFESNLQSSKGGGMPLSEGTRGFMESRIGADFSGVRIHTDTQAADMSRHISAHAFTHGNDIYFNNGQYAPHTDAGSRLLAHELTHTIQQGASPAVAAKRQNIQRSSRLSRKEAILHRAAAERPSPPQLSNAVAKAKGEEGKVNAGQEGPDGYRLGWERLTDYFKTTLGPEKVIGAGGSYVAGAVAEQDIKKQRMISNALPPAHPSRESGAPYVRDAMPSWCGIFVFWALHKAGVPMKPWQLGGRVMTPEAAYPPGHVPQAGDIAYRKNFSHFAIVDHTSGNTVTTVNGNTAGEDNLGGQVQTRDHPLSDWTAFFDPLLLKNGPLSAGETNAAEVRPLTLKELRKKLFHVDAKKEESQGSRLDSEAHPAQSNAPAPALSSWQVNPQGQLQRAENNEPEQTEPEQQELLSGPSPAFILEKATVPEIGRSVMPAGANAGTAYLLSRLTSVGAGSGSLLHRQPTAATVSTLSNKGPPGLLQRNIFGDAWDAASGAYDAASDFAGGVVDWAEDQINEAKGYILERIRDYVAGNSGYRLVSVILQRDPVTGTPVVRNGHTLLEAGLNVIPGIGAGIRTLLYRTGLWNDAALFVEGRIGDFIAMVGSIAARVAGFIDGLSIADIRHPVQVLENFYELVKGIIEEVVRFVCRTAEAFVTMIKRVVIREVAGFVQRRLPRLYPFLRVALGFDPITDEQVPRNGANILNALFAVTDEGLEQKRQLLETGAFQKVAAWIDQGISVFTNLYQAIRSGFTLIWDVISVDSLLHPAATLERIYGHFATPVRHLWQWIGTAARFIIETIKEALLGRLSNWAREQRGYFLITLLIGRDPFTQRRVAFSVENVIRAFMSLMEGGEAQFQQMKESGAVARAAGQITAAVKRLGFTLPYIVGLFTGLWRSLSLRDLANPIGLFRRVIQTFAQPVRRLVNFVVEIVRIVVTVILQIMQFPTDLIANIIGRAMAAWDRIKRNPIGFLKNLLRAIKQGFVQFFGRILDHLTFGLTSWLMAELRDSGVPVLSDFSLRGVITWVLAVLNISMESIWQKLATHPRIGPERVARIRGMIGRLEGIWTFIKDVQERGMAAIWEKIQEQLSNLWETVLGAVRNWIMEQIVNKVVTKLLSMLDPTGIMAVINSAIAIYRAIQSFVRYVRQLLEIVNSFVMGVADIAAGNVRTAANFVEGAMRQGMPVMIGFLANQAGLSGIGRRVGELIGVARQKVDDALTWLVHKAVDTSFAVIERLLAMGRSAVGAVAGWLGLRVPFRNNAGEAHNLYIQNVGGRNRLMIASTPKTYTEFVATFSPRSNDETNAKARAVVLANEVDNLIDDRDRQNASDANLITSKVNQIASISRIFSVDNDLPPSVIEYGPVTSEGGATRANARILSKNHVAGSTPQDSAPIWRNANRRRPSSSFIRGHLLNHHIGGPGLSFNLTPITGNGAGMGSGYANRLHLDTVEQYVKSAIDANKVLRYDVRAQYLRHPERSFQRILKGRIGTAAEKPDDQAKLAIMDYEQNNLCVAFSTNWAYLKKSDNGAWIDDEVQTPIFIRNQLPDGDFTFQ